MFGCSLFVQSRLHYYYEQKGGVRMSESWESRLLDMLANFRENNMLKYRQSSEEYKSASEEAYEACKKIDSIRLTREEREIIDNALDMEASTSSIYIEQSYIQGISDCLKFLHFIKGVG